MARPENFSAPLLLTRLSSAIELPCLSVTTLCIIVILAPATGASAMDVFVIPIASAAIPSALFKLSELAVVFLAANILTIAFSRGNDLEGYAIMQSPFTRQITLAWKIGRSGRIFRAVAVVAVVSLLALITFYNTLLWSLIDLSGPVRITTIQAGLNTDGFYPGRFWALNANESSTQDALLALILPGIGTGYYILSSPDAFQFNSSGAGLAFKNMTEMDIELYMEDGAYTTYQLLGNTAPDPTSCTAIPTTGGPYQILRRCAENATYGPTYNNTSGIYGPLDWGDLDGDRPSIYVSPESTYGLTGSIQLSSQGSAQAISRAYSDSVEGLWGQIALDDQVITFTNLYSSQTREFENVTAAEMSSICTKVLLLSNTTDEDFLHLFNLADSPASIQYLGYDPDTGVITKASIIKTTNISQYSNGNRRDIAFCAYAETRLSLLESGSVMLLPKYECQEQSFSQGIAGVETFSQCEDGGFNPTPPYTVRANIDASLVLAQPYAFKLAASQLVNSTIWDLTPSSLFYIMSSKVPQAYRINKSLGTRILYGKFYGYGILLVVLMFSPIGLAILATAAAWFLVEDTYFASLLECVSAYTDPATLTTERRRRPTKARYRQLTRVDRDDGIATIAFDDVEIFPNAAVEYHDQVAEAAKAVQSRLSLDSLQQE